MQRNRLKLFEARTRLTVWWCDDSVCQCRCSSYQLLTLGSPPCVLQLSISHLWWVQVPRLPVVHRQKTDSSIRYKWRHIHTDLQRYECSTRESEGLNACINISVTSPYWGKCCAVQAEELEVPLPLCLCLEPRMNEVISWGGCLDSFYHQVAACKQIWAGELLTKLSYCLPISTKWPLYSAAQHWSIIIIQRWLH